MGGRTGPDATVTAGANRFRAGVPFLSAGEYGSQSMPVRYKQPVRTSAKSEIHTCLEVCVWVGRGYAFVDHLPGTASL